MSQRSVLELRTSPSPSPAPPTTTIGSGSGIGTTLPSFDDLLRSIEPHNPQHHANNGHLHHYVHARYSPHSAHTPEHQHPHMTHAHGHSAPYPPHHHHSRHHIHDHPHNDGSYNMRRAPSTPPTPSSLVSDPAIGESAGRGHAPSGSESGVRTRPRSSTAPSISRTHMQSPFKAPHALPNTYEVDPFHNHGDRIRALKDGDGEWSPWSFDAVVPAALPYHARPHPHPRISTGSIPLLHQHHYSPLHTVSQSEIPRRPAHNRHPSLGSHSPLSMNVPLTPGSIHASYEPEFKDDWRAPTPTPSSAGSANGSFACAKGPIAQPQAVRIPMLPRLA